MKNQIIIIKLIYKLIMLIIIRDRHSMKATKVINPIKNQALSKRKAISMTLKAFHKVKATRILKNVKKNFFFFLRIKKWF